MDLLCEERIQPALAATTRDGAIGELLDLLVAAGAVPAECRDDALAAVLRREASQTTGLGAGIAIPHGVCEGIDELVGALGIARGGLEFAAVDGEPVQLVILLVVPPNRYQAHIRTLAGIARVLNDPRLRELIVNATAAQDVMDILVEREEATV